MFPKGGSGSSYFCGKWGLSYQCESLCHRKPAIFLKTGWRQRSDNSSKTRRLGMSQNCESFWDGFEGKPKGIQSHVSVGKYSHVSGSPNIQRSKSKLVCLCSGGPTQNGFGVPSCFPLTQPPERKTPLSVLHSSQQALGLFHGLHAAGLYRSGRSDLPQLLLRLRRNLKTDLNLASVDPLQNV